MQSDSGKTTSAWMATTPRADLRPALAADSRAEVCIVGAGIAGLTTAYLLRAAGLSVIVLDDGPVAGGETCRTTAHLSTVLGDRYHHLERLHGEHGARLIQQSHSAAIDRIEMIVDAERIDCGFCRLDGYLFVPAGEPKEELDLELEAAARAGCSVERVSRAPIADFDTGPALRFARQAQLHPLEYLGALAHAFEARGGRIFNDTHVKEIVGGSEARVQTTLGPSVRCEQIVVATNSPVNDLFAIHTKQAAYRTFAIGARIPKGSANKALFWDTLDPYHYVRIAEMIDHDVLIVGGEDHKTGQADDQDDRFEKLVSWGRARWPMMEAILYRWSGQVMESVDGLAFIGRNPGVKENVFVITGDSGNGMTHGTIGGMLIRDLIGGRPNEWATVYDPSRKSFRSAGPYLKENLNVVAQMGAHLTAGDVASIDEIPVGHGAVVRIGMHKRAVYRDVDGGIHECSANCPHLGCVVAWNQLERSWDCPCHGSRFDAFGRVINGPALSDLRHEGAGQRPAYVSAK